MLQPLAREMNFSETVFVYPPRRGRHVRIRIFTPAREVPFAGHPTLGTAFVLAGPLQLDEIRLETGVGIVPVRLEREGAADRLRPDGAADPDGRAATTARGGAARGARRRALGAAGRALRQRAAARVRHARLARTRSRRCGPTSTRLAELPERARHQLLRRLGQRVEDADVRPGRRRRRGSRRPARRPARSRSTSRGTAGSPSARRSRSRRAPRSGGPSTLYARVDGSGGRGRARRGRRLGGRRRPRRVPALERDRLDLRQLEREADARSGRRRGER